MKTTLRRLAFFACVVLFVFACAVVPAAANTGNTASEDGITVSLDIPKDSYAANEELEATLSIQNFSLHSLSTVRAEIFLPDGVELVSGTLAKTYPVITAGTISTNTVKLAPERSAAGGANWGLIVAGGIGAVVAVAAVAVGLVLVLRGKKIGKTAMIVLLLTALVFTLIPHTANAEDGQKTVELSETVTVGGKEITVTAVVTYTVNTAVKAETIETTPVSREETTRKDLENALVEVAWDYYLKKGYYQYGSMELTTRGDVGVSAPLAKDYGGTWRTNTFSDMEDATADSLILSVCSDYCFNVYDEALEYPVLGNRINAVTIGMFRLAEQCGDGSQVIMRWYDSGVSQVKNSLWTKYGNTSRPDLTAEEAVEFMRNWEETMRPGDIIVARSNGTHQHAMLYVGKGQILHCGGGKFDMDTFVDKTEPNGAVSFATVEGTYITGTDQKGYFKIDGTIADDNTYGAWLIVLRPLNLLTIDDGDGDPGNDKLDVDYVLDVGQLKTELANNDNHPTKTSGYGVSDATWTRMQYPGMNIDRTVNISLHKTAASGELLTYRIAITNNSNESYFAAYHTEGREAFYMGQGYANLPVSETVPEYTELVRVSHGGEVDENGVIRWNINVPVGETVTLSYTVKVTGQPGDRIVNNGGFVGNIPSNSITTIVGGRKLSSATLLKMQNFFTAGSSKWNSNDGYKISADPEKDTQFVERIYEELVGVKLDLPSIETIKDIFFTQGKYYQPWGLHINHENPLTRYMYTLNDRDEVAPEYQYVWDMLVEGYYGGVWVYSNDYNDEPRITELRYDYLEVGDILVNIRLKDSFTGGLEYEDREVTAWQLQVYLGNGRFAFMDYEGKFRTTSGSIAINPSFGQDMFVCLRPTQAYTNIYEDLPAYEGPAADLTEKDAMNVFIFEPSSVLLNEEAIARLQKLTAKGVLTEERKPMNLAYAGLVYATIGLDIVTDGIEENTYAGVVKACFEDDSNNADPLVDVYEHLYTLAAAPTEGGEALYKMLLYYGGPIYKDSVPLTSLDQLYPGDVLIMGRRTVSAYMGAVYQGNGKFMAVTQMKEDVTAGSQIVNWFDKEISSDEELVNWLAEPINEEVTEYYLYEGYIILRPSRAYDDINSMVLRDMNTGKLTKEEKEVIANLDLDAWLDAKRPQILPNFPNWIYKEAHIDLSRYFAEGVTVTKTWTGIFRNDKEYGYYVPMKKGDYGYNAALADMLVADCYGGKYIAIKDRKILSYSDVQVGDILCAARRAEEGYVYLVALYQGGSQWLVTETPSSGFGKAYVMNRGLIGHDMSAEWIYYFLLRPEQVADGLQQPKSDKDRDITTGELTSAEKNKLANYTTDKKAQLEAFAANAYGNAGVDVTQHLTLNVNNTRKELFTDSGLLIPGTSDFHKMLVPGYYGGAKNAASAIPTNKTFKPEDFQIGDIFCGFMNDKCCDKWQNVIGIYQGNGKFLVSKVSCEAHGGLYTDISGKTTRVGTIWADIDKMNEAYMYYYVLRPQRLAGEHLMDLVLSQTDAKLTVGGELTLTYTPTPDTITVTNVTWESADPTIATVDDSGKVTAVAEGETYIRLTCDGLTVQCKVKVYARNIVDGKLTTAEQAIIAGYTIAEPGLWHAVVNPAYEAAGIYVEAFDTTIGFNDLRKAVFDATASDYTKMLVPGYTGGSKLTTTSRTFVPADLKAGDVIATATAKCEHGSWTYLTGIYVGDGKFVVSKRTCATEGCAEVYVDEYGKALANGMVSFWSQDVSALKGAYEYYFVLRPQQLATRNITEGVLTTDELTSLAGYSVDGGNLWYAFVAPAYQVAGIEVDAFDTKIGFNDLRKAVLSTTESDYTKMLIPGYTGGSKFAVSKVFTPADLKVGDIIATATAKCSHGSWQYLTGIYQGDGKILVSKRSCTTAGCAGVYVDEYGKTLTNGMVSFWSDAATLKTAYEYYFVLRPERLAANAIQSISLDTTAVELEIDDNVTLTVSKNPATAADATTVTWTSSNTSVATVDANGKVTAVAAGTATITVSCDGYTASCEITVKGAARDITTGVLTPEEITALQNVSLTAADVGWWRTIGKTVYDSVGVTVDIFSDTTTGTYNNFNNFRKTLFDNTGALIAGTTDYHKMLIPGYYGGAKNAALAEATGKTFVPADFKVGDIFCTAYKTTCAHAKWQYVTAIYQGDGKFMVCHLSNGCTTEGCIKVYTDTYGVALTNGHTSIWSQDVTVLDNSFDYYFVLRPERLAVDAIQSVGLDKAAAELEIGNDLTLAVSKNPATAADATTVTWTSSNTSVATVDATGKVTAVAAGTATITVNCDGYTASCEVTVKGAARDITTGVLTPAEIDALKNYVPAKPGTFSPIIKEAYEVANIDLAPIVGTDSWFTVKGKIFDGAGNVIAGTTNYHKMLMPGYYGGVEGGAARTFTPADFKIGDVFAGAHNVGCSESGTATKWVYITGVYIGDGKFMVSESHPAACTDTCSKTYVDTYGAANSAIWATEDYMKTTYKFYFVLRPERLAVDAIQSISLDKANASVEAGSDVTLTVVKTPATAADAITTTWTSSAPAVATVDANGKVTAVAAGTATITVNCDGYTASCEVTVKGAARDITTGVLTPAEIDALKNYVPAKPGTFSPIIKEAYEVANIDLAPIVGTDSWFTVKGKIFDGAGNVIAGTTNYHKMLMPGYYGGVEGGAARTFTPADFKIGDVFAGAHNVGCSESGTATKWVYITGVYIGDGKFMVSESHPAACTDTCSKTYVDTYGAANSAIWATEDYMKTTYKFYFVLRPERLASDAIQSVSLDKTTALVEVGNNVTLAVSKNPATAADATTTTWTSSKTAVATVDANGKVTAVAAGEAIITVNCDGYTASCTVTVEPAASTEPRDIHTGVLTTAEMNAIKALNSLTIANPGPVAKEIYTAANISVVDGDGNDVFGKLGFSAVLGKVFNTTTGELLASPDATYGAMLMPGYYGGSAYKNTTSTNGRAFVPADFKVGDLMIALEGVACAHSGKGVVTGVYIGGGKFLLVSKNTGCTEGCNTSYIDAAVSTESVGMPASAVSVWSDADALNTKYKFYFVLRPERLAGNAVQSISLDISELTLAAGLNRTLTVSKNPTTAAKPTGITWTSSAPAVATVDADGKVTAVAAGEAIITVNCDGYTASCTVTVKGAAREIVSGALTKGEMNAISSTGTDIFETYTSGPAISAVYAQAAIDLSGVYAKIGAGDLVKIVKGTKTNETVKATYVAGTYYGAESGNGTKVFVPADFVVGDVLVANYKCTHSKWPTITAIYQGEGKFLVVRQPGSTGCTCSKEAHFDIYDAGGNHNASGHVSVWGAEKDAANTDGGAWLNYLVFRPSQLAD